MSYRQQSYSKDPRTIEARYPGTCAGCGNSITRGQTILYYPKGRTTLCMSGEGDKCGKQALRNFRAEAADEAMIGG